MTERPIRNPPVTAIVSWAHDDADWEQTVATFALRLREFGIDADLDLFHLDDHEVDWSTYGPQAIENRQFVLLVVSAAYRERWEGHSPREGAGAAREANVLKALFDEDQAAFRRKVKVVILPGRSVADVPRELRSIAHRFEVDSIDLEGIEPLLRSLTGQPKVQPGPVGELPLLPPTLWGEAGQAASGPVDAQELQARIEEAQHSQARSAPASARARNDIDSRQSVLHAALHAVEGGAPREGASPPTGATSSAAWNAAGARLRAAGTALGVGILAVAFGTSLGSGAPAAAVLWLIAGGVLALWARPRAFDGRWMFVAAAVGFSLGLAGALVPAVLALVVATAVGGIALGNRSWSLPVLGVGVLVSVGYIAVHAIVSGGGSGSKAAPPHTSRGAVAGVSAHSDGPEAGPPKAVPILPAACTKPALTRAEREVDSSSRTNDTAADADGPLQGGSTVRGATQTQNDEDWLYFCSAGRQTHIRFVSADDDDSCSELSAEVETRAGNDVLEDPLNPSPATAATADVALKEGRVYRVKITADGARCRWLLGVGPPGVVEADADVPQSVPCVPAAETATTQGNALEPNDAFDDSIVIGAPPFEEAGGGYVADGEIANGNDEEWFAFCGAPERRAFTVRLTSLDQTDDFISPKCSDLHVALLDADDESLDNADPTTSGRTQRIAWTAQPGARYYVTVWEDGSDRCRWRLRIGPRTAMTDQVPPQDWDG